MSESIRLLKSAVNEIRQLRQQNQLMSVRLQMFDDVMTLLHADSGRRNGIAMSPDLTWEIEKFMETQDKPVANSNMQGTPKNLSDY